MKKPRWLIPVRSMTSASDLGVSQNSMVFHWMAERSLMGLSCAVFKSLVFWATCALYAIAKLVGHSGTKMIEQVYGHLRSDYLQGEMSKIRVVGTVPNGEVTVATK